MLTRDLNRRLSKKRLARVPRFVGICALAWTAYAIYFCTTGRLWSMKLCIVEAVLAFSMVAVASHKKSSRTFIAHLNLFAVFCGLVAESVGSGGFESDTPLFLSGLGLIAAFLLGLRAAVAWTAVGAIGVLAACYGYDPATMPLQRVPTNLDQLLMACGYGVILFFLAFQAETSFAKQVSQLVFFANSVQERTRLLKLAEQTAGVGHWHLDLKNDLFNLSDQARNICGVEAPSEFVEFSELCANLSVSEQNALSAAIQTASTEPDEFRIELEFHDKDGIRHVSCRGFSEKHADGNIHSVFGVFKDQSDAHRAQAELLALATLDPLTELPNRHSFQLSLDEALRNADENGTSVALLLVDMDGFKQINDTLGHPTGDVVLKMIAERLRQSVGEGNYVARLGGDEFIIIQRNVKSRLDATMRGKRIAKHVGKPYEHQGRQLHVAASIGAAIYPEDTTDSDELLSFADTAMYRTKDAGDSVGIYTSTMTDDLMKRHEIESRLATALDENEYSLVYQPQVTVSDQKLVAFEALIRWNRDGSVMSPVEFIPLLESTGRIVEVGRWILNEACRQTQVWVDAGYDVGISVNISPVQFRDENFVSTVWSALEQTQLLPERLDLELTESVLIDEVDEIATKLDLLKSSGSKISIDDFGTGYSSLAYLKHLPIDRLKIDRAFIKDIPGDDDGTIAKSMIVMSRNLGISVLAEGVETEAQLRFLRDHGCDEYQGYLFSKPLSVADASYLLSDLMAETSTRGSIDFDVPRNSAITTLSD